MPLATKQKRVSFLTMRTRQLIASQLPKHNQSYSLACLPFAMIVRRERVVQIHAHKTAVLYVLWQMGTVGSNLQMDPLTPPLLSNGLSALLRHLGESPSNG
jgi:hypothetical protein